MINAGSTHTAGGTPCATDGIVQLGTREVDVVGAETPCCDHLAVGQQGSGMINAGSTHTAGGAPCATDGIV